MDSLSVANTNFALHLFKKINENNKTGNVFYSPLSISSALAMVTLGAGGNTAAQMCEVLCFNKQAAPKQAAPKQAAPEQQAKKTQSKQPVPVQQAQKSQKFQLPAALSKSLQFGKAQDDVHIGFCKLMSELNKAGAPYALNLANRLYGEQSYQFVEKFLADTKTHYKAELEAVDFKTKADVVRVHINTWVEKQTKDKIKNLLPEGILDSMTRLVLVNAIYFKGSWEKKFDVARTQEVPFKLNKKKTKPVKMMHQKAKFPLTYIPDVGCRVLEMPYIGKELSMLIMLPTEIADETTGLQKLEKTLTPEAFLEWTRPDMMDTVEVELAVPQFKLEETYDMKQLLVSMGMVDAFDASRCDFSRMSPGNDLVLSEVVHKAFVEVNEEGTEAAAATAAIMMCRCLPLPPERFVADHPFLFFIQHKPTRSILFCGRYSSP